MSPAGICLLCSFIQALTNIDFISTDMKYLIDIKYFYFKLNNFKKRVL